MALKAKLLQTAYDALPAALKTEYKQEGEDWVLDIEELDGHPGVNTIREALTRAKGNEVSEHNKTKAKLTAAEARVAELEEGDKTRTNDTKAIEERHKKALEDLKKTHGEERAKLEGQLSGILVDAEAQRIASDISDTPEIILPHIKARLKADLTGDVPVTVVLDTEGQPSTKKVEDLSKEFVANKKFATIIRASKASGGGARQSGNGSGATGYKGKKFAELNEAERVAFATEDPTGFETAKTQHQDAMRGYSRQ